MKNLLKQIIIDSASNAIQEGLFPSPISCEIKIDESKNITHGDFSTNLAMKISKIQKMSPKKIAEIITNKIEDNYNILDKIEIISPGFINFFIKAKAWHSILKKIHTEDANYGKCNIGHAKHVQIEFVSSNPTGPLHVGHGRGAAVGDSLANILSACGYNVQREYYINDSGRQISTLGLSVYLRSKEILGSSVSFPEHCYQGDYIKSIAKDFILQETPSVFEKEKNKIIKKCAKYASKKIIALIRKDLEIFGITFDRWFSEQDLYDTGKVEAAINYYTKKKLIYEEDGAKWFATSKFGDEKDRVVVRKNGLTTYFASDIAYHKDKFDRGFEQIIDVLGADHHGYVARVQATIEASGKSKNQFKVILVRLVNLLRNTKQIAMSTRSGNFITLRNVIDEVGSDAARFLFLTRHYDSPLDFDIELAKKKNNENPVYYVQYVHARISSILLKGQNRKIENLSWNMEALSRVVSPEEIQLMKKLASYPETVKVSCQLMEPHRISFYLMELSSNFHTYYNKKRILTDDLQLTKGRLYLALAVKKVIANGLKLLGINAPQKM